jgi:hypothetical protein
MKAEEGAMSDTGGAGRAGWAGGLGVLAVLVAAGAILARSASAASGAGLALVTGGVAAILLLGFPGREVARAVECAAGALASPGERRRAAGVWEAAARSAWVLSAASAIAGFVSVFSSDSSGIARFLAGVGDRAVGVALGVLLAVVFAVPALRLAPTEAPVAEATSPPPAGQRILAGVALLALLAWPLLGPGSGGRFAPLPWLLHGPAWLVVGGGALVFALYLRGLGRGASIVVGLAAAGTVAVLLGLTRGLHGFATRSIDDVAGGLMFAISSGYAALAGLAALGLPLLDRDARDGRPTPAAARWAVGGFPLVVLTVVVFTILLVMVPMEKPAG